MSDDAQTNVAIACQGGGSHTAFTAGVLKHLFREWDDAYDLVGISGRSGGAFNALAAWYGLVTDGEERAADLLEDLWEDLAADDFQDRLTNRWMVGSRASNPAASPFHRPRRTSSRARNSGRTASGTPSRTTSTSTPSPSTARERPRNSSSAP
jgi:NTE family protein